MVKWIDSYMLCLFEDEDEDLSNDEIYKLIRGKIIENSTHKMVCCSHPKLTEEQEDDLVRLRDLKSNN